jgi:cardiolipin synthase
VIPVRPDVMSLYRLNQLVADVAQRTLWLVDAYFVATTAYVHALTEAAKAGVDVRLLVPDSTDLRLLREFTRASYRPLLEAGVRVFEWNGPMMHAKTAVADGCWSRVGSSNSNFASWVMNREMDVAIYDTAFAAQMEHMFLQDLENATEIVLESGRVRPTSRQAPHPKTGQRRRMTRAGRVVAGAAGVGSIAGAALSRRRVIGPSEARVLGAVGALALLLAVIALVWPLVIGVPVAVIAGWSAVSLLTRAWRLRMRRSRVKED